MSNETLFWLAVLVTAILAGVFAWESWRGRPPKGKHRTIRQPFTRKEGPK